MRIERWQLLDIPELGFIIPNMGISKIRTNQQHTLERTGIADGLFTKVQQRVLGVLYGNTGRSFYANEVIGLANTGTGAVQRELARLERAELVTVTRIGNQKHYQANAKTPVFDELRGLVLKTSGLADELRAALGSLADQITAAFVYGSVAKRQDTAKSDIDLMVVSDSLSYADLFAALEASTNRLGRPVNPTVYTQQELSKRLRAGNAFVKRVLTRPKLWLIGGENVLAS